MLLLQDVGIGLRVWQWVLGQYLMSFACLWSFVDVDFDIWLFIELQA